MAEVYLARRKAAGVEKWLVVKRIRAERSTDVRFLDLFVREARLSMSLTHQNIVPVFDFGRIDDQVFLAMERIEGKDLGSTLAHTGGAKVTPLIAAFIAAECCQALDYAHRRKSPDGHVLGIVHRDVTPRNVLLSWSGEVKLTDFGIAALAGDASSSLVGTPAYMAPEQARGETVDARADVYALGLVLRELITGERARPGEEREATLAAAKAGRLKPWPGDAPAELVAIVDRATALAPADRFPDARSMLNELDGFIVAERAAHKVDAPARQLAEWLADVWGAERDDAPLEPGEVEGSHLVSFLDDGALDVVGTGTERSMAATAADESAAASAAPLPLPLPLPLPSPGTASVSASSPAPGAPAPAPAPGNVPIPIAADAKPRPAATFIAIAAGLAAVLAVVLFVFVLPARDAKEASADAAVALPTAVPDAAAIDAAAVVTQSADAAEVIAPPVDAAEVATGPADAASRVNRPNPPPAKPDAAVAEVAVDAALASPPPVTRKVTINAIPWAYFTVDGDPTQHETMKTILLSPGPHVLHFSNPELGVTRDVTIEVPADRDHSHVERLAPKAVGSGG